MDVEDFDVPVRAEERWGPFEEVGEYGYTKRRVGGAKDRDMFGCGGDSLVGKVVEAGGADEDRDTRRNRAIEARLQRGWRRKVDQYVAIIRIESKPPILGDGGRNGLAHAAVGGDQSEADRLLGSAHRHVMAKAGAPRNLRRPV